MKLTKFFICSIMFSVHSFYSYAQVFNDLITAKLNGPVKSIQTMSYDYEYIFGEYKEETSFKFKTDKEYNENGMIIKDILWGSSTELLHEKIYKYMGIYLEEIQTKDFRNTTTKYLYDDRHNPIQITDYATGGKLISKTLKKYDDSNRLLETQYFNAEGTLGFVHCYTYNEKGEVLSIISYDGKGKKTREDLRGYEDGNCTLRHIEAEDEKGSIIELSDTTYSYTSNGFLESYIKRDHVKKTMLETRYKYEIDNRGNWIIQIEEQKVEKFGKEFYEPKSSIHRVIEYY